MAWTTEDRYSTCTLCFVMCSCRMAFYNIEARYFFFLFCCFCFLGLIKQFMKDTFWGRLDFLIFGKLCSYHIVPITLK